MTSVPQPTSRRTPGAAARIGGTVAVLLGSFVVAGIVFAVADAAGAGETTAGTIASAVMAAGLLVLALALRRRLPAFERRLMLQPHSDWQTAVAIGLGVALLARLGVGILTVIGEAVDPALCRRLLELDLEPTPAMWQKVTIALSLVVLAPLGEELLFRGILLRGFVRIMPFASAATVSGLLFGAAHLQYFATWPVLLGVGLFGVANSYVYRRHGYRAAVLAHAIFNAVAAVFLFVELPEQDPGQCDAAALP